MLASDARTSRTNVKLSLASGSSLKTHAHSNMNRISTMIPSPCLKVADLETGCTQNHGKRPAVPQESSEEVRPLPLPSPWETEDGEAQIK